MKKLLFITNLISKIGAFSLSSIASAKSIGAEFFIAGNWKSATEDNIHSFEKEYGIHIVNIPISRNPFSKSNITAYKKLVELVKHESIDFIHCNTPTGGVLGRLVGKKCKVKKVIYQAHGFHFYKGAPKKNWLIYYPVEKCLAHYTDAIITINHEDFELAHRKLKLRNGGKIYYVPGVGIDTTQYSINSDNRNSVRNQLGLRETDIAVISMGDLIERKNYSTAIRAIAATGNKNLHYYICGQGPDEENLKMLVKNLNASQQIHFLGFRTDIKDLLHAADIFLFTTKQEGLPRSMMEAMASGLPCIASKIRGNTDLINDNEGGYLCETADISSYAEKLNLLASNKELRKKMGNSNLITIRDFSTDPIYSQLLEIYEKEFVQRGGATLNEYASRLVDFFPVWAKKRMQLNIPLDAFVLISVGELNMNKNNISIIKAMKKLKNPNIHYVLCGVGEKQTELQTIADTAGLHFQVHFLGFRNDVKELYEASDCFVMPSYREGLSRSIMEAMASGLPCIVSKIRGNVDLIENNQGGFLCNPKSTQEFASAIDSIASNPLLRTEMSRFNREKIKGFDQSIVTNNLMNIYRNIEV